VKKYGIVLYIALLMLPALACQIARVGSDFPAPPAPANALPTLEKTLPTLANAAACLIVRALPGGEGNLNLRAGAGTSYAVLAVFQDGQTLTETDKSGDWYAVTAVVDGRTIAGYVHSDYVEVCE